MDKQNYAILRKFEQQSSVALHINNKSKKLCTLLELKFTCKMNETIC